MTQQQYVINREFVLLSRNCQTQGQQHKHPYADTRKKRYDSLKPQDYSDFILSFHEQFWRVLAELMHLSSFDRHTLCLP